MYNSNTDSLELILGVEVFFSLGHCSGALCIIIMRLSWIPRKETCKLGLRMLYSTLTFNACLALLIENVKASRRCELRTEQNIVKHRLTRRACLHVTMSACQHVAMLGP